VSHRPLHEPSTPFRVARGIAFQRASDASWRSHVGQCQTVARNVRTVVEASTVAAGHVEGASSTATGALLKVRTLVTAVTVDPIRRVLYQLSEGMRQNSVQTLGRHDVSVGKIRKADAWNRSPIHLNMDGGLLHVTGFAIGLRRKKTRSVSPEFFPVDDLESPQHFHHLVWRDIEVATSLESRTLLGELHHWLDPSRPRPSENLEDASRFDDREGDATLNASPVGRKIFLDIPPSSIACVQVVAAGKQSFKLSRLQIATERVTLCGNTDANGCDFLADIFIYQEISIGHQEHHLEVGHS